MNRLETQADLQAAVSALAAVEPRLGLVAERHGLPPLRPAEPGLRSLLRIVTDQLISLQAGQAIWGRLEPVLGSFSPGEVLGVPEGRLRLLGLSHAKARTFHAAAHAVAAGALCDAGHLTEHDVFSRLTQIPGVGPWTANLYLLSALRTADAWPAGDVALQHAAAHLLELPARPDARRLLALAEPWRPHRSAAALLLWSHYRRLRALPPG